ncbi:hypothetical protein [Persephonella hydrogeniphila]|uniref:hypothetical protein n=1 Tax=Persephonella hydrogeniphila TaxID=198703 RepID=UPI0015DEAB6B|nr:hypothetical protein [Persephonella hydrogeniphila]
MFRKKTKAPKKISSRNSSRNNLFFISRDRQNYRQLGLSIPVNGGIEVAQP